MRWSQPGPFGEFVVEVHDGFGLWGPPGPAGVSVADVALHTLTGVGAICVKTPSMWAALVGSC